MLGNLRNRFWSLQEEITTSVRQFTPSHNVVEPSEITSVNPYAGGHLLEAWQVKWEEIHRAHERNAREGRKCDKTIAKLHQRIEKQNKNVMTLQTLGTVKLGIRYCLMQPLYEIFKCMYSF